MSKPPLAGDRPADLQPAPITEVLVLEDRAQVTRRAPLQMAAGRHTLGFGPLTPLCADPTLRCRLRPAPGAVAARLLQTRVRREYLTRARRSEEEQTLTAAIEKARDEYRQVRVRALSLQSEWQAAWQAAEALKTHLGQRVGLGVFVDEWKGEAGRVWELLEKRAAEWQAIYFEQEDRHQRIRRLEDERRAVLQPVSEYRAWLEVDLQADQTFAGELEVIYQVPCALWRPQYTAELSEGRLCWQSAGVVWQATGEEWLGVELRFSTARPALGAELPLLTEDRLSLRPKTDEERKIIEVCSRDQRIARTESAPAHAADTPPGLDDGGEVRTFVVPGRVDVPADGCPHRLEYDRWETTAEVELVCYPERAPYVFLRTLQPNASVLPLLAGPVTLIRQGGFVGRSAIGFVAPGERFALSFGSDDELVVLRRVDRRLEETALRRQQQHLFVVQISLRNFSLQPQLVKLGERLPLSEIDAVEVVLDRKKTTPGFQQDDQGILTWPVPIEPGEDRTFELHFSVTLPHHVRWEY